MLFKASVLEYLEFRHFPSEDETVCNDLPRNQYVNHILFLWHLQMSLTQNSGIAFKQYNRKKTHCWHKDEQENIYFLKKYENLMF